MASPSPTLITGATGFIGSRLTRSLAADAEVHIVARDPDAANHQFSDVSIRVHKASDVAVVIADLAPTTIYHLATRYERHDPVDPTAMRAANVVFGTQVLDAASRLDQCNVVLAGSFHQIASSSGGPTSAYAASKQELVDIAVDMSTKTGLRWIQTVLYEVYGPHDPRDKLVPNTIARIVQREQIQLPSAPPLLSFCYVDDAVSAFRCARRQLTTEHDAVGKSVFARVEPLVTPNEVVATVADVLGVAPVISPDPYIVPASTVMEPPDGPRPSGWQPVVSLRDGISRIVNAS